MKTQFWFGIFTLCVSAFAWGQAADTAHPIAYGCHQAHACPDFALVGGVTCVATHPDTGEKVTGFSVNGCLAERNVVSQICAKDENPQEFDILCHRGKTPPPTTDEN